MAEGNVSEALREFSRYREPLQRELDLAPTPRLQALSTGACNGGVAGVVHAGHMTRHQTGLMVLRVWTEEGSTVPLRVNVRRTDDLSSGSGDAWTLTDLETVLEAVRTFLEDHTPAP